MRVVPSDNQSTQLNTPVLIIVYRYIWSLLTKISWCIYKRTVQLYQDNNWVNLVISAHKMRTCHNAYEKFFFTPACLQRLWGSVVNETGIDLLAKESMRCWIVRRAHTAKFSPSSHRICVISTRVNGRMSSHIPLPWISTCSNGKFIHENVFRLPLSPRTRKLFIAWPLHPACSWTLSQIIWMTKCWPAEWLCA